MLNLITIAIARALSEALLTLQAEIYDILTHLTFIYIEADKIRAIALDDGHPISRLDAIIICTHNKSLACFKFTLATVFLSTQFIRNTFTTSWDSSS